MKKVIGVMAVSMMTIVVVGCGKSVENNSSNNAMLKKGTESVQSATEDNNKVTKDAIKTVQSEIEAIKAKTLKIQADESLSKEEKAEQLKALQAELQETIKKKTKK